MNFGKFEKVDPAIKALHRAIGEARIWYSIHRWKRNICNGGHVGRPGEIIEEMHPCHREALQSLTADKINKYRYESFELEDEPSAYSGWLRKRVQEMDQLFERYKKIEI